ncbi:MAG: threonine ammonia-lyase [Limnochordia bacterium]
MKPQIPTLDDIEAARARIGPHLVPTPLLESRTLGELCGRQVLCKFENLQMTGSFKERGALNKLLCLSDEEKARGVVAASAGNHAQGLAYHARRLGIPVTIVMPLYTPVVKVVHTQQMGARVIQAGDDFDQAYELACDLAEREGLTLVHPFDDPAVIAGQGTIGLELVEAAEFDSVLVPVGGGGLISGIAIALKALRPSVKVIGVEAELCASMKAALAGTPFAPRGRTIADGIAVRNVGRLTAAVVRELVDGMVSVSEGEIAHGVQLLLEIEKTLVEGAGAVGLAALLHHGAEVPGERSVVLLSGGNMDITMLAKIIERGLIADGRLARLVVRVPDVPGGLAAVTECISKERGNIRDVVHHRAFSQTPLGEALVEFTVETRSHQHVAQIEAALKAQGYEVRRFALV